MNDVLIPSAMLALAFLAGWKCRTYRPVAQPAPPTPYEQEECNKIMSAHRQAVSKSHDEAFFIGVTVGQKLTHN